MLRLVVGVACVLFGFTAGQHYEQVRLREERQALNAGIVSRRKALERSNARAQVIVRELKERPRLDRP